MKKSYFKYLLALLLFGSNGIVASHIALTSYEIVLLRCGIGSVFLITVFAASRQRLQCLRHKKSFVYIMLSGLSMGATWMFLYEAYQRVGVSVATLAYYCGPVLMMALSPLVFRERLTAAKVLGFLAVLVGMVCVNGRALLTGGLSWGLACGLLSAVMFAALVIFNKKAEGIVGLENAMLQLSFSFVAVAVFTLIRQGFSIQIPAQSILPVLLLGFINTGAGCYLYFSAIPHLPTQSVALWGYLEPVSALFLSAIFLAERLTAVQLVGTVLVLGGAAFGELYRGRKRALHQPPA